MGLAGARNSAVTGLQAQSTGISIAADNIANASTPGYKAIKSTFSTLVTNSGSSTGFSSGGVEVTAKNLIETQGLIEATGRVTDLAISGNGFFPVQDESGNLLLTRAGSFDINNQGQLVNTAGYTLLGWPLDNDGRRPGEVGNLNTTAAESPDSLEIVDINSASGTAAATTTISIGMNLNAGQNILQGATAEIDFNSAENSSITSGDVIVPASGMQRGDSFNLTASGVTTTFTYGGFATSLDLSDSPLFGASTTATSFTPGTNLVDGDAFTISTVSSGTVTFTYKQGSPDTTSGEFNSLDTLATAISLTTGLTARTSGTILYVSSEDASEAITFDDILGSNLHNELGFSNILSETSGENRFNTLDGLKDIIDGLSHLGAVISNASSGAGIEMYSSDPLETLTVTKNHNTATIQPYSDENGNNSSTDLIVPPTGVSMIGQSIVFSDNHDAVGNSVTATYGGIEESDTISSSNAMFGSTDSATAFSSGVTNGHQFTINDGTNTRTFTYDSGGSPDTSDGVGEFDSLETLAEAINNDTYFRARVANGVLYVSSVDADLGLTFANLNATDFLSEFGLSNVAASGGATRFATLGELQSIIDGNANFTATLNNSTGNATITVESTTATTGLVIGNSGNALIKELGLADNSNVGDGFFTELGLTTIVDATDSSGLVAVTYDPTDTTKNMAGGNVTPHFPRNLRIYDSLGTAHDFRVSFLKVGTNEWAVEFYSLNPTELSGGRADGLVASGIVLFNGDGSLRSVSTGLSSSLSIAWSTGAVDNDIVFDLGTAGQPANTPGATVIGLTDGLRQFDSAYNVDFVDQNGVAAGQFSGIEIGEDGTVSARFSNGELKSIYQLPILVVANQNGLKPITGNVFQITQASGDVNLKIAGQGGSGTIISGSLEGSTADIAEELTRTIGIQSNYNANATLISTVKDMEEELNRRL